MLRRTLPVLAALTLTTGALAEQSYGSRQGSGRPTPLAFNLGEVTLTLSGRAQVQAALYVGDDARLSNGEVAEEVGFRLRRARLGLEAEFRGLFVGVEADLLEADSSVLNEAYVGWNGDWTDGGFTVTGGVIKVPMSRSALISSEALQDGERSLVIRGMAPEQQLGFSVSGRVWEDRVRLQAGLFNGMERDVTFAGGWSRLDPADGNRFGGFAGAARLDLEPIPGTSLLGDGTADLEQRTTAAFGLGGGFLYNDGPSTTTLAWSADLAFKGWGVGFLAEWIEQTTEPEEKPTQATALPVKTKSRGATAQLGYTILAHYLEVAIRADYLDDNTEVDDEGDLLNIGATLSGYLMENRLKVQLYYEHRTELHGADLANDVLLLQAEGRF